MQVRSIELLASDGYHLAGTLYEPLSESGTAATRTVVINSGTGIHRRFYDGFARYACDRGLRVLAYDYRGIGDSLHGDVRRLRCNMSDWGSKDLAGVIDEVERRFSGSRLLVVGHSAGGQILGLAANNARVHAMLAVGMQSGYWRLWPRPRRYLMGALWFLAMPALARTMSYFPARRLGLGEELPAGVALQWAHWCRRRAYLADDSDKALTLHFDAFGGPLLAYSMADDAFAPPLAAKAALGWYGNAAIERRHVRPADIQLDAIGHFGFFKRSCQSTLWQDSVDWLRSC